MASRSLVCSLDVSRPNPENRPFAHPDPIAWTVANCSRLMRAFYTLLLWNPYLRLSMAAQIAPKTRFKTWWSSIGAPIQAVTNRIGAPVDFTALFAANEVGDEEADGVAAICDAIDKRFGRQVFTVKEFCVLLDPGPEPAGFVTPAKRADWRAANEGARALRERCSRSMRSRCPPAPCRTSASVRLLARPPTDRFASAKGLCVCGRSAKAMPEIVTSSRSSEVSVLDFLPQRQGAELQGATLGGWREKYSHLLSRPVKKLPELPKLPDSKALSCGQLRQLFGRFGSEK